MTAPMTVTVGFSLVLVVGAAADLASRRVPNVVVVAAAIMGVALRYFDGGWIHVASGVAAAVLVLALLVPAWNAKLVGGGDVKLASAAALGIGLAQLPWFAAGCAIAGGVLALIALGRARTEERRAVLAGVLLAPSRAASKSPTPPARRSLPYGIAIAVAAIAVVLR